MAVTPSQDSLASGRVAVVGTGFVADLYMRSLQTFPGISVVAAYDRNPERLASFARHWGVPAADSLDELIAERPFSPDLVLNLTNPASHFEVSQRCLELGRHVYSEKPLAMEMSQARWLHAEAQRRGLILTAAPCSVLGRCAQELGLALRQGVIGQPRLVYAELDDDFIPQAPYTKWRSESGAPWPAQDEFEVGCTVEHAGYYLTWLIGLFGSVKQVVAASANLIDNKLAGGLPTAPDFSTASLFFASGLVARLTCSIVAPHDHRLRVFGDHGVIEVDECWNNRAPVRFRRRYVVRRRLVNSPWARRIRLPEPTHPHVGRRGAASMNFALGPAEVLAAQAQQRPCRLSPDLALHVTEVTLAIQNAGCHTGVQEMTTESAPLEPMPWAKP